MSLNNKCQNFDLLIYITFLLYQLIIFYQSWFFHTKTLDILQTLGNQIVLKVLNAKSSETYFSL